MNSLIESLNAVGDRWLSFAGPMLIQSSILIVLLFALDLGFRCKLRPAIRYALWLIVLVKLLLPPSFALPTSAAWWLRPTRTLPAPKPEPVFVTYSSAPLAPTVEPALPAQLPPAPHLHGSGWMLIACAAVGLGLFFTVLSRWGHLARRIRSTADASETLNEILDEVRCALGFTTRVQIRLTSDTISPAVCGLWSPVILLPRVLAEQFTRAELRSVLLHELMHLKRWDIWVNCVQILLQIVYWWHPLLWIANARIRRVREEAVDDAVMLALRDDASNYAPTLIQVAKLAFVRPRLSLGLVGIIESHSALRQRIERLVNFPTPRRAGISFVSILGIAALTATAVPMAEAPPKQLPAANKAPLEIRSDSATFNTAIGQATFSNNVVVAKGSNLLLTADNVTVNRNSGTITAAGNVNLIQDTNTVKGDQLDLKVRAFFFDPEKFMTAFGIPNAPADSADKAALTNFLAAAGIDIDLDLTKRSVSGKVSGKNVFYGPNRLMLRATAEELDAAQKLLESSGVLTLGHSGSPGSATPEKLGASELIQEGRLLIASGKLDEAEAKFKQATDLDPQNEAAAFYLSETHRMRENKPATFKPTSAPFQSNSNQASNSFHVRLFKLAPNSAFVARLQEEGLLDPAFSSALASGDSSKVRALVQTGLIAKFAKAGVDLRPETGKNIYWDDRASTLLIRATPLDLDTIESVVVELNISPPQILVRTKIIELPEKIAKQIWARWAPTNSEGAEPWSGVLSPSQTKDLLKQLESLGSVAKLINSPSVTTLSGRQAQIQTLDTRFIYYGVSNGLPAAQQYPLGMTLDLIPSLAPDDQSIQLTVTPTFMEFLGYEDSKGRVSTKDQLNPPKPPTPHFRVRQINIDTTLLDGSTLMLGRPSVKEVVVRNQESQSEPLTEDSQRNLLVLVTPTLMTPTGERMHPDQ